MPFHFSLDATRVACCADRAVARIAIAQVLIALCLIEVRTAVVVIDKLSPQLGMRMCQFQGSSLTLDVR
jgi:hypothetical protein